MNEDFETWFKSVSGKGCIYRGESESFGSSAFSAGETFATEAMQAKLDAQAEELAALRANLVRLEAIESAATALVKCKGRYHAELNMKALIKAVEQKL